MCGRGGVAGDVTVTSQRGCKGSTGRRSLQSRESGVQALRRRVGEEHREARGLEAENKELRARIDAMEKKEGVHGGPSILSKEGGDSEDVWREFMEVEDETERRKKLHDQKKKLQKELRDVDRLSFVSKEMQESNKESL